MSSRYISCASLTSSEVLLPVFVTVTLTVTFCPVLIVVGMIFRSEYLKVVYELQINLKYKSASKFMIVQRGHTVHIQRGTVALLQNSDRFS